MITGVLLGLGASASWAIANVAVQRSGQAVGAARALLWAQLAGGAGFALLAVLFDHPTARIDGSVAAWGLVAGIASLVAYGSLFYAFERARLSVAVPIMSSWAVVAAAMGVGLFGERLRPGQIAGAATVVAGVILVAWPPEGGAGERGRAGRGRRIEVAASLGAALGFGVLVPAMDRIAPATGRLAAVSVVYALDLLLGLPLALALGWSLAPPPAAHWPKILGAGFFETLGFAFISLAAARAPLAVVSPTASLSAAMTVLYAWIALRERPGRLAAAGAVLASAGVIVLSL